MTSILAQATQNLPNGVVPTDAAGALQTATNVANAAATVAQVANAAASTALDIKAAWSSPDNCIHSNYCRIPVAIIIAVGIMIIVGCICCIKGCADCIACCCCRSSRRTRERLRPPEPGTDYGYGQQPPPTYQPQRATGPGGGSLFPMPERPKYEPLNGEEQGIEMKPTHAYLDGDKIVPEPKKEIEDTTPLTAVPPTPTPNAYPAVAATGYPATPTARMPRTSGNPYPLDPQDNYYPPPQPITAAAGRSSPVRRDYSPSPVRSNYRNDPAGMYSNAPYDRGYGQAYEGGYSDRGGYNGGGGYRDDGGYRDAYDAHYNDTQYYENSRGGYGSSRGGGFNV